MYLQFREKASDLDIVKAFLAQNPAIPADPISLPVPSQPDVSPARHKEPADASRVLPGDAQAHVRAPAPAPAKLVPSISATTPQKKASKVFVKSTLPPVMGPRVVNGSKPLFGFQHKGTDAIMALACKYPVQFYKRFVGTLRKFGFTEDIVLAVSTVQTMKPGVEEYLKQKRVLSYAFDVECAGPDNCRFTESFLG